MNRFGPKQELQCSEEYRTVANLWLGATAGSGVGGSCGCVEVAAA